MIKKTFLWEKLETAYELESYLPNTVEWGRNKCMCESSQALCYGHKRSCAIHNSFAPYGSDVIFACRANKTECWWTQTLTINFPFLRGKRIQ